MDSAQAKQAGREIGDLIVLLVDFTPNKEQLQSFIAEGFQAAMAVGSEPFTSEQKDRVVTHIAEGLLSRINEARPLA